MKIRLFTSAFNDLAGGRNFYERQGDGLGEFFLNSLFSDIDSLVLYGGIHRKVFGFHRLLSKRFPYAIYYQLKTRAQIVWSFIECWTTANVHAALARH